MHRMCCEARLTFIHTAVAFDVFCEAQSLCILTCSKCSCLNATENVHLRWSYYLLWNTNTAWFTSSSNLGYKEENVRYMTRPYIYMIHLHEPRLQELLFAPIIQAKIIFTTIIISRSCGIENHYHLIHNPAVHCRKGGNQWLQIHGQHCRYPNGKTPMRRCTDGPKSPERFGSHLLHLWTTGGILLFMLHLADSRHP